MAKTAKPKKNALANPRSRASKRATSPSIDTDKSLRDAPRASDATPVLAAKPYGGVTKSKKKKKAMTRGQRKRHEKGLARAEVVQDQLTKKVGDAHFRLRKVRERKSMWEDTNSGSKFDKMKSALVDDADEADNGIWEDEEMEESEVNTGNMKFIDGVKVPSFAPATKLVVVDRTASMHNTDAEDNADIDNIT